MLSKCTSFHLHPHPHHQVLTSAVISSSRTKHTFSTLVISSTNLKTSHKCYLTLSPFHRGRHSFPSMASSRPLYPLQPNDFEPDSTLINDDLKPTDPDKRTFSWWEMASLWVGLVVGVPSYYLAGSLVDLGMAWWQGIATVVAANVILFFPLVLTGQPGTLYGISFPVLARSSLG